MSSILGHQLGHALPRIGGEAHVAVGQDADQLAGVVAVAAALHHRDAGDVVAPSSAPARRPASRSGWMVSGLTTMPDSNFLTWRTWAACSCGSRLRCRTPMPPACAMAIAILVFGHRVHGGGDDRQVERDRAGDAGADIDLRRQHVGQAGLEQHVVEGERLGERIADHGHNQLQLARTAGLMRSQIGKIGGFARTCILARTSGPAFGLATVDSTPDNNS